MNLLIRPPPGAKRSRYKVPPEYDFLIYDFSTLEQEQQDDSQTLWDLYARTCYSQDPPIPALSLMRPILFGDQNAALFAHQQISRHLPIILDMLARTKLVSEIDISDNSLTSAVIQPLITFVNESDQLSLLALDDNPLIGPHGMQELLEGIKENHSLETVSIANTGCTAICGHSIAALVTGCASLLRLNLNHYRLRQSVMDIAQALPSSPTLKRLSLAQNELFYGQRRLAVQLGANCAKCAALSRLDLSQNALTSEMAVSLLRGLSDTAGLRDLDLSWNEIGETAGRAVATFLTKSASIKKLNISQNPLLKVTANKVLGQQKMDEEGQKPGGNKKAKAKVYVPGCYLIATAVAKSPTLKEIQMYGLVVNPFEWEQKLLPVGDRVKVLYRGPDAEGYNFRPKRAPPPIVRPAGKPPPTPRRK
jgi:Ran GTPase-activating protein (RanGAP) involved in mRNA processing and transport